jgi:hypothetical protein
LSFAATPAHVYVWYRVAGEHAAAAGAIASLLRAVLDRTGVAGRLLARCDGAPTWMEVYENVGDTATFTHSLATLAERHGALRIAAGGQRNVECFAELPNAAPAGSG